MTSFLATRRAARLERRAVRTRREQLRRELASFTSEADQLELSSILDRHAAEVAEPVRALLPQAA